MRRAILASATGILSMCLSAAVHADVEWAYQVLDESLLPQRDLDIDLQARNRSTITGILLTGFPTIITPRSPKS